MTKNPKYLSGWGFFSVIFYRHQLEMLLKPADFPPPALSNFLFKLVGNF